METRFRLRRKQMFVLPQICCVCASPAGRGQIKAYGSNWFSPRLVTLFFPLCDECEQSYRGVSQRRRRGCGIGAALTFLLVVGWVVTTLIGGGDLSNPATSISGGLLIGAGVAFVFGLLSYAIVPLFIPREERDTFRRIEKAVEVKSCNPPGIWGDGDVVLRFAQEPFATLFKKQNEADLLEVRKK